MTQFSRHIQSDGSTLWWQADPGRYVSPEQYQLVEWLASGGVPDTVPYVAPPVPALADLRAAALERVRAAVQGHILAAFPDWYQRDCALGVYPETACAACRDGIAACVEASNAAEDAIAAATDAAGVDAASAALVLPALERG